MGTASSSPWGGGRALNSANAALIQPVFKGVMKRAPVYKQPGQGSDRSHRGAFLVLSPGLSLASLLANASLGTRSHKCVLLNNRAA